MSSPKLDPKMMILPLVFIFGKKIDWKDPYVVMLAQRGFMTVCVIAMTLYYFIFVRINKQKEDSRKIWVPPKPKPTLPFGLGPPAEPIEAKDFEATTYKEYEIKLLKEAATQVGMSVLISGFMSMKFESHQALLIQGLMMPFNVYDSLVVKKYIFGKTKSDDGSLLYHELYSAPTAESLKIAENVAAARAAAAAASTGGGVGPDEPRVVELPAEDKDDREKKPKSKAATTAATDID